MWLFCLVQNFIQSSNVLVIFHNALHFYNVVLNTSSIALLVQPFIGLIFFLNARSFLYFFHVCKSILDPSQFLCSNFSAQKFLKFANFLVQDFEKFRLWCLKIFWKKLQLFSIIFSYVGRVYLSNAPFLVSVRLLEIKWALKNWNSRPLPIESK